MKLGSLFDGSGGFPLAGMLNGITPIWSSEIEPFPIRVTTKRFPNMKHYGDVSSLSGADLEPVDIITFGSPCQDLSTAGKRAGLEGKRSGLFFEAIRIIKEMRDKTNGKYPRYAVWENVRGALSSNNGEDFRCVLEEICSVKNKKITIPRSEKWNRSGEIVGNGFSVAWRVLDAQYWGVPQRRERIYLIADFDGGGIGQVLFESEGMPWNYSKGFKAWKEVTRHSGKSLKNAVGLLNKQDIYCIQGSMIGRNDKNGPRGNGVNKNVSFTLNTIDRHAVTSPWHSSKNSYHTKFSNDNAVDTLVATDYKDPPIVYEESKYVVRRLTPTECARLQGFPDWWCSDLGVENPSDEEMNFWKNVFETHRKIVTHSKKPKTEKQIRKWLKDPNTDSAEYKMWGNGIALPCAVFVLGGIVYENSIT